MSEILIVSRTKMANDKICIGGIDLEKLIPVRLLDVNGYHESKEDCPYNIRETWDVEYLHSPRPLPHTEDVKVIRRTKSRILKQEFSMLDILKNLHFKVHSGNIKETFEGKLKYTNPGTLYVSSNDVPRSSTCFWICDREIIRKDYQDKIRYSYNDGTREWGYHIPYVGLDENPVRIIPKGTLTRLSLAHWWSPQNLEDEKRCYLQLSAWY